MSQHSQRTQFGPSRASIVAAGFLVVVSMAGTGYVFSGPGFDLRELVGGAFGLALAGTLFELTAGLIRDRAVARERVARAARVAEREARERENELGRWQVAAAGLLDAYLTGRAIDFGGHPVPQYVQNRLADLAPPVEPVSPPPVQELPVQEPEPRTWLEDPEVAARYEPIDPYEAAARYRPDSAPMTPPTYPEPVTERIPAYREPAGWVGQDEPLTYRADPARPWRAFEPATPGRTELTSVAVPLPPRGESFPAFVPVSPGRQVDCDGSCGDDQCPAYVDREPSGWSGAETEVIKRVTPDDATLVIPPVEDDRSTEVIDRVR